MRIDYCKFIIGVADLGSITQAAEHFFISQQGLSQAVKSVERELGTSIFTRMGNQMLPTATGQVVIAHMRRMLAEHNAMQKHLEGMRMDRDREDLPLTILVPYNVVNSILSQIVNLLLQSMPNIRLHIEELPPPAIPLYPNYDSSTVGILCVPDFLMEESEPVTSGQVIFEEYARGPLMALVSTMSPLSSQQRITNEQLRGLPIAGQPLDMMMARHIIGDEGCELKTFINASKFSLNRSMIAKGQAIGLSSTVLERFTRPQALTMVPLEEKIDILWGCTYSRENPPGLAATEAMLLTKSVLGMHTS